jgi:hypothetical protein
MMMMNDDTRQAVGSTEKETAIPSEQRQKPLAAYGPAEHSRGGT